MTSSECHFLSEECYVYQQIGKGKEQSVRGENCRTADTDGLDMNKNAVQRIEAGKRFVTDIELKVMSVVLEIPVEKLLE